MNIPRWVLGVFRRVLGRREPESRTTPSGLFGYSNKFLEAAERAVPGWRDAAVGNRDPFAETYPVCEYLVGHGVELALKAYLLACGAPERDLRFRYGHDISKLLKAARKRGLDGVVPLNADQLGVVRLLSVPYRRKELEYHGVGGPRKQPLERGVLVGTADALARSQALRNFCHAATAATIERRRQ